MMDEMFAQGSGVDIEISFIQFIGASGSMDTISMDAKANLYFLEQGHLCESETKTLKRNQSNGSTNGCQISQSD